MLHQVPDEKTLNMAAVHQTAKKGFELQTDAYDAARPSYPKEAVDEIFSSLKLPSGAKILDLASGTGIFTRLLHQRAEFVVEACEPAANMRKKCTENLPDVRCFEGTSTNISVPDQTYDVVVVAQAFHWFANVESLKEIHRVLKPNGALVLIWNLEDREAAKWVGRLRDLYEKYEDNTPQFRLGLWKQVWHTKDAAELFQTPLESKHFTQLLSADREKIWLRVLSKSYVACQSAETQEALKKEVLKLLQDEFGPEQPNERIPYPYKTELIIIKSK